MHAFRFLFVALELFLLPAAVLASDAGPLAFEAAWIRAAPPFAPVMAGYVRIVNRGSEEVAITALTSEVFGAVEAHEMREADGVMRMRTLPELRLAPGESLALTPGSTHLMLMRPLRTLAVGEQAPIEFELSDGHRERVLFEVRSEASR